MAAKIVEFFSFFAFSLSGKSYIISILFVAFTSENAYADVYERATIEISDKFYS